MSDGAKIFWVLVAICLVLAFIAWWPFVIIWALNTLFGLSIASTWTNWLAVAVLTSIFSRGVSYKSKS